MTPEDFARWVQILRVDPLVLMVLWVALRHLHQQHAEAMALLRSLRDEVMQLSGRLVVPDDTRRDRRRGDARE